MLFGAALRLLHVSEHSLVAGLAGILFRQPGLAAGGGQR